MDRFFLLILLVLLSTPVFSQQLVLIQGYLGQPSSWSDSGIAQLLEANGWSYTGEFIYASDGARLLAAPPYPDQRRSTNQFYLVALPTESSIQSQAYFLTAYLKILRERFPAQKIILVGHSAGGVLARYVMVRNPGLNVGMLITIASPHLGTESAQLGKIVGSTPLAMVAPFVGANTVNRSQGLYSDLLPEKPNRFLFWLNRQPHPKAEYISIVKDNPSLQIGDYIVSKESQHLENVYSLRHFARSYVVHDSHGLSREDGGFILSLISEQGGSALTRSVSALRNL